MTQSYPLICLVNPQIITFFGGRVYTEGMGSEASRLSFAGDYLNGDASLLISDLLLTDSGEYYCKVKTGGKYHWSQVNLIVLGECSQTNSDTHTLRSQTGTRGARAHVHIHTYERTDLITGSLAWHISSVMLTDLLIQFDSDSVI